jgi:oligoribonuclease
MAQNQNNLVWIDMEMTGLLPDTDRIIEVALVVTDGDLNTVAEARAGRHGQLEQIHAW